MEDKKVNIYKYQETVLENGKKSKQMKLVDEEFRIIRFKSKQKEEILLITNCFHLSASDIADIYKRRWDIEVFFRFIKQELNFSHFISLNENGIQIVMYMK